jgi:thiamine kinase-like enzyme
VGRRVGLDRVGAAGILAAAANILAMFRLVKDMRARDKVLCIAFAVCAAFTFGDHLAFTANFQPNLLLPVIIGKLTGGICGFLIASWLCVPKANELEKQDMIDYAHAILQHIPAFKGKAVVVTPIGGGMTNRIYKVDDINESYVLRVFGHGTEHLGINREREVACSHAIAGVGLGAEVVAFLPELAQPGFEDFCGALVVRFVPGKLLESNQVHDPVMLKRIATTLRQCHDIPIDGKVAPFSVFHTVRDYIDKANNHKVPLPSQVGDALAMMQRIEIELASNDPACLCHNDLLAGNFLDDGATLRIIDWEYGGSGDRFFDLGNFAANLKLSPDQEKAFLETYFGEARPEQLRRLKLMRIMSDLREASWGFLQHAIARVDPPKEYGSFLKYGEVHLERMVVAAESALKS